MFFCPEGDLQSYRGPQSEDDLRGGGGSPAGGAARCPAGVDLLPGRVQQHQEAAQKKGAWSHIHISPLLH